MYMHVVNSSIQNWIPIHRREHLKFQDGELAYKPIVLNQIFVACESIMSNRYISKLFLLNVNYISKI